MRRFILSALCLLALAACKKDINNHGINTGETLVLNSTGLQMATADNGFTFRLLKAAINNAPGGSNLLVSPLSVSMALSMTSNGSNGQTLAAIMNTLDFQSYTQDQVNTFNQTLITALPQLDPLTTLKIANSIWYSSTFTPLPAFLQTNSTYYQATVQGLDFSSPTTVTEMNNWVNTQTNGKITSIVNQIPSSAVMYLINAIYFKGTWKDSFNPKNTAPGTFNLSGGGAAQATYMSSTVNFNTMTTTDGSTIAELPYGNDKYSMVLIMPSAGSTPQQYVAALDPAKWQTMMSALTPQNYELTMPKFQFSYTVDLTGMLSTLGMANAFGSGADFTRINAAGGLSISDVLHKTFIDVDEAGTTAAAVTSVTVTASVATPNVYRFNGPFLFFIRERTSGLILFAGVMNNPTLTGN